MPDSGGIQSGATRILNRAPGKDKESVSMKKSCFIAILAALGFGIPNLALAQKPEIEFSLVPIQKVLPCLSVPGGPTPTADVIVQRGELNDVLILRAHNLKPNLGFDLFTVQNSNLQADGTPDPNFPGSFGLAWYQTDVQADSNGEAEVTVKTILLDQIFGFDPLARLAPTHTFHVGFWFNNPQDAVACGFNASKPTPFNGEQKAGPLAFISLPDPTTHLGPLCTDPQPNGSSFFCKE